LKREARKETLGFFVRFFHCALQEPFFHMLLILVAEREIFFGKMGWMYEKALSWQTNRMGAVGIGGSLDHWFYWSGHCTEALYVRGCGL
jgi:hypothetical protein